MDQSTSTTTPTAGAALTPEEIAKMVITSDPMNYLLPYILSLACDSIALGIVLQQFTTWLLRSAKKDPIRIKFIVGCVAALSIGFTAFWIYYIVILFVKGFGTNYLAFSDNKYTGALPIWHSLTVVMSHIFFTERAYRLNGQKKIVLIILCPMILLAFAAGPVTGAKLWQLKTIQRSGEATTQFLVLTISAIVTDITILGMVTKGLMKSKTGWSSTDALITRLIRMAFETQTPGTIGALTYLIFYHLRPNSGYNIFIAAGLPKVYTISLMVVLNSRMALNEQYNSEANENRYTGQGISDLSTEPRSRDARITVSTETWKDVQSHPMPEMRSINRRHLGTTEEILDPELKPDSSSNSSKNDYAESATLEYLPQDSTTARQSQHGPADDNEESFKKSDLENGVTEDEKNR